jgi:hypothetical protein
VAESGIAREIRERDLLRETRRLRAELREGRRRESILAEHYGAGALDTVSNILY